MRDLARHTNPVTLLCLLCGALILLPGQHAPATNNAPDNASLRSTTELIHCAGSSHEAEQYLQVLRLHNLFAPGLPNESDSGNQPELRATTLDKILQVLSASAIKYPKNKYLIEQTVIQWNFCSVLDNRTVYDHIEVNGKTLRYPSALANGNSWSGFYAFGLLPEKSQRGSLSKNIETFNYTTPYTTSVITSLADRKLQQSYIAHCLPHPDDNHLYRDYGRNAISRIFLSNKSQSPLKEINWSPECEQEIPVLVKNSADAEKVNVSSTSEIQTPPVIDNLPEIAAAIDKPEFPKPEQVKPAASKVSKKPIPKPARQVPTSVTVPIPPLEMALATTPVETHPRPVTRPWSGDGAVSPDAKTHRGFSGSISLDNRRFLARETSLSFAVSYKPIKDSYWFIRSGISASQESKPLTYSWGIGYDDWHAGTWGVQLNHWGPLQPGDGLDIRNAVAEVSYKFKGKGLEKLNLSSSLSLSKPLSEKPSLNWGWSWNPYSHWFLRTTFIKPLGDNAFNWSYGFGFTRYENKSLSIEYNNWGPNEFPESNFRKNALVSLIYRWAF